MTFGRRSSHVPVTWASAWSSTWQADLRPAETVGVSSTSTRIPRDELRALHRSYNESTDPAERDRNRPQLVDVYHEVVYSLPRQIQNRGHPLDHNVHVG